MSNILSSLGLQSFRVPKDLMKTGAVDRLSPDALRLYLIAVYELYLRRKLCVTFHDSALRTAIRLKEGQITVASRELEQAGLLRASRGDRRTTFHISSPEQGIEI